MYFENRGQGTFLVGELTFIKNVGFRKDLNIAFFLDLNIAATKMVYLEY